jgi:hypothetical protein
MVGLWYSKQQMPDRCDILNFLRKQEIEETIKAVQCSYAQRHGYY